MSLWKRLFGGKPDGSESSPEQPAPSAASTETKQPSPKQTGAAAPGRDAGPDERRIRVFVSSTFRDMQAERDILIKKIFPQLRKLCEERAVSWTEVDLRWGITTEESAEGKVLPLCLAEIERCRPYFIGLLGERYGWVPDEIDPELIEEQPWLEEHKQQSVTELEILHGVLNNPEMSDRSLFYFRDPDYLNHLPKGSNAADIVSESTDAADKLAGLKDRIRARHDAGQLDYAPRENYADPEALGEQVLADFTAIIEKLYPKDAVPDPLDQEAARHEAYAQSRRLAFVGREDLIHRLDEHFSSAGKPLVLTGESGCGKSALLAEWVTRWRKEHSEDLLIQHYIGSTPDSADWQGLVRRILGELKRAFGIKDDIPTQPEALRGALIEWTTKSAGSRRVVLVLDALNQLSAGDAAALQLGWLPVVFPTNFRVLVSSLPGESLDALRKREWPELNVPLFSQADIKPAALAYFKVFSKTPSKDILAQLGSTPAACNPLYLRAVLDELRQFGIHEKLQAKASEYLSAPDLPALFDRILTRWDEDFGNYSEHPDLVRRSLCLIACARFGLSEGELLDLLGKNGKPLPRRHWTPLYLAAESALALRAGLLNFGHDHLRAAVRTRWLNETKSARGFRVQLLEYFARIADPTDRKLDELPTLFLDLEQWEKLKDLLSDIPAFLRLRSTERWKLELHGFWIPLRQRFDMGKVYREALAKYEAHIPDKRDLPITLNDVAVFHYEAADHQSAEPLYRRALAIDEQSYGPDHPDVAIRLNDLAQLLYATNRLSEAEPLMRRALAIDEQSHGPDHPDVATCLNNLAGLLEATNRPVEAEPLFRRALAIDEQNHGPDHPNVARDLNNLAVLLDATNRLTETEPLYRRALAIDERSYGPDHPDVARDLNNLAMLLRATNRLAEAEPLMRRALAIWERCLGTDHPNVASAINNLAQLLRVTNRLAEAEPLVRRALAIAEQSYSPDHPDVAIDLNNLAQLLQATNRLAEAETLYRRALAIDEQSYGTDHPDVATSLNNLAQLLQATNRLAEAEPLHRRALAIDEQSYGTDHPDVARDLNNLAQLLQATNRPGEAEPMMGRALAIWERSLGADHPNVALAINNLAGLLMATNRLSEAEPLMRRSLTIFLGSLGQNHPYSQTMAENYKLLLEAMGHSQEEALAELNAVGRPFGIRFGD